MTSRGCPSLEMNLGSLTSRSNASGRQSGTPAGRPSSCEHTWRQRTSVHARLRFGYSHRCRLGTRNRGIPWSFAHCPVVRSGKFEDALSVFNKIPWDTKPDSVLLVNPVKSKADMGVVPPMGLAHLIAGDNQVAVDYIRLRLGRLERLERVTTDSPEGFTRTGEQAGRADFGRRRPLSATELVLGRQDASHRTAVLRQQRSTLGQNAAECEQEANRSRQLVEALEKLVGLEGRIRDIERWLNSHIQEQSALDAKAAMQEIASAPDLLARQLLITEARRAARQHSRSWKKAAETSELMVRLSGKHRDG